MRKFFFFVLLYAFSTAITLVVLRSGSVLGAHTQISGAPPDGIEENQVPDDLSFYDMLQNWVRPEGPPKVGLQVGHWKNDEVPEELKKLKDNTGASGGGKWEWEVNHEIATLAAEILRKEGVEVDIIPATVPPGYWADVFLAIHADGNEDTSKSGYKFATPWRDFTRRSDTLVALLTKYYEAATKMERDPNITRNMRGYYAFAWWKYEHTIHPMTTAAIAETGFLTSAHDRMFLINSPQIPATAIADAIIEYLETQGLL